MADASAIVRVLTAAERATPFDRYFVAGADIHVPAACDVEVVSVLTRAVRAGLLLDPDARTALLDYTSLPIERHGHLRLIGRVYLLRDNFGAEDALYVALAETLGADLLTADRRLARAVRQHTEVTCLP